MADSFVPPAPPCIGSGDQLRRRDPPPQRGPARSAPRQPASPDRAIRVLAGRERFASRQITRAGVGDRQFLVEGGWHLSAADEVADLPGSRASSSGHRACHVVPCFCSRLGLGCGMPYTPGGRVPSSSRPFARRAGRSDAARRVVPRGGTAIFSPVIQPRGGATPPRACAGRRRRSRPMAGRERHRSCGPRHGRARRRRRMRRAAWITPANGSGEG